jgi:hypothetical protein
VNEATFFFPSNRKRSNSDPGLQSTLSASQVRTFYRN